MFCLCCQLKNSLKAHISMARVDFTHPLSPRLVGIINANGHGILKSWTGGCVQGARLSSFLLHLVLPTSSSHSHSNFHSHSLAAIAVQIIDMLSRSFAVRLFRFFCRRYFVGFIGRSASAGPNISAFPFDKVKCIFIKPNYQQN